MEAKNPWLCLPLKPPLVLPEDKEAVLAFNQKASEKGQPHGLDLQIIPIPFLGSINAPVVLLGNISGSGSEHAVGYRKWPAYAERMRRNLLHENPDPQFLPMDPRSDIFPHDKEWWTEKLKHLLDSFGNGAAAESILARSLLAVEYFPYRSLSNEYHHDKLSLITTQGYSRFLVYKAMENGAVIVIRHGRKRWFDAVRGLKTYQHLVLLREARQTHISPKGVETANGYQKIVDKIRASVATTDGRRAL